MASLCYNCYSLRPCHQSGICQGLHRVSCFTDVLLNDEELLNGEVRKPHRGGRRDIALAVTMIAPPSRHLSPLLAVPVVAVSDAPLSGLGASGPSPRNLEDCKSWYR